MVRYETLILTVPEITKDETSSLESQIQQFVKKAQGSVISFDRWGKYRLAYRVHNNEYGVYFLTRFETEPAQAQELITGLRSFFTIKFPDLIMRHMTTNIPLSQSLSYQRPESLEDTPTRDVDTFLRENKMEGLLSSVSSHESKQRTMDHDSDNDSLENHEE